MANLDVLGLGLATLDVLMRLEHIPNWDRPGGMSEFGLDGGGPAGTACVAAARLGARVGFIGTAGTDVAGELKLGFLAEHGVDITHVHRIEGPETQVVAVYVHERTGERVFLVLDALWTTEMPLEALDRAYVSSARFLHLDGYYPPCALQAARWVHQAGGQVCLDCRRTEERTVPEHAVKLLSEVDFLICGSGFCRALTGEADIWRAGPAALACGPRVVVETRGEAGSFGFADEEAFHTPAFEVEVLDTTGAGDVFHGAWLVAQLYGWDLRGSVQFATAAAALKCSKLGGRRGIPGFDETVDFLSRRGVRLS